MSERLITAIIAAALAVGVILALAIVGYIAKVVIGYAVADERIAAGLFVAIAAIAILIVMEGKDNRLERE